MQVFDSRYMYMETIQVQLPTEMARSMRNLPQAAQQELAAELSKAANGWFLRRQMKILQQDARALGLTDDAAQALVEEVLKQD